MALGVETLCISGVEIELNQFGVIDNPALLYLHSGLGRERSAVFLQGLGKQFRVIAPTHPGFGASSWPQHLRLVSDLAFCYLDLADQLQLRDAVLVGACFGGWLAAEILIRSTARFGRLVLIDALGAKFSDRFTRDITDIHGLTEAEAASTLYYNPAHAVADYANLPDDALNQDRARPRGVRLFRVEAVHAQPEPQTLAAPHRYSHPSGMGCAGPVCVGRLRPALCRRHSK